MEWENLKTAAEKITMSEESRHRIARNCETRISNLREETAVKNRRYNYGTRKHVAVFAVLAIFLSLSVTVAATSDAVQGFFREIANWQGAIVGTSYQNATNEIDMSIAVNGDDLTIMATFVEPQKTPYSVTERLGIGAYKIVDVNGQIIKEGAVESAEVVNGRAAVNIRLDDIRSGSYKLLVSAFVSESKADQPLNIFGNWESGFNKE